ncbi:ribbon-helix-helix domain-containing protein [Sarcina ventriculi]|uniref:ribbon-helix-helix domain-containing protein n=1 Tax=Sarcina ventriculi TaxID=1267 RepID=UPI001C0FAB99|nr:ribbon-helix-helix domain-containing protein [Sarcina ventriculi]MBU5323618.1 ribbon-helix-helix domain-containing protein [Sarcina ventriculi]
MENKYGLTNRVRISNAIDKELWKSLKEYSKKTGIPISKLLDKSIQMFLDSVNKNNL